MFCATKNGRRVRPHSEADTATSFFGAVKVDSFAQGLLQGEKKMSLTFTNECLIAAKSYLRTLITSQGEEESLSSYLKDIGHHVKCAKTATLVGNLSYHTFKR